MTEQESFRRKRESPLPGAPRPESFPRKRESSRPWTARPESFPRKRESSRPRDGETGVIPAQAGIFTPKGRRDRSHSRASGNLRAPGTPRQESFPRKRESSRPRDGETGVIPAQAGIFPPWDGETGVIPAQAGIFLPGKGPGVARSPRARGRLKCKDFYLKILTFEPLIWYSARPRGPIRNSCIGPLVRKQGCKSGLAPD
jgi:hypothetical protein